MNKNKNYNYFNEFIKLSDYIVESVNILKDIMKNFNLEKLNTNIYEVHRLENEADKIVHKMRGYLIKDFLPPIDREDIALIINKLDNIEDGIDEVLINIKILDILEIRSEVAELIDVLVMCCVTVKDMFIDFNNMKNIDSLNQKVIEINKLEEIGDKTYEKIMELLYKNEKDPINLIKWTNMYKCLEDTIDCCEEIGDCIQDVVMKNS